MSDVLTGYLAPADLIEDLAQEIKHHSDLQIQSQSERLFLVRGPRKPLAFAQNTWLKPQRAEVASIGQAAKLLRSEGKLWAAYSHHLHRRTQLIQESLPKVKDLTQVFGEALPDRQLGAWTLQDEKTLWFSAQTTSPFANGEIPFTENKNAPSRAYLKLWEYFTLLGHGPTKSETCLDLGSSPGGWTWVLSDLGKSVISVDKADLDPKVQAKPNVKMLKKDAFALEPAQVGAVDWLFSDIICYPPKLYDLVQTWMASGLVKNMVCTIKFQAETDFATLERFQKIPGSTTQHLSVNKHELTWSLLDKSRRS